MVEERASEGENEALAETPTAFDSPVNEFLAYLEGYRHYSPWTVGAYRIDLREFREFLLEQEGRVPAPSEITRPQVVAWGLSLKGMKPLTIATLRSSDARSLRSTSRPQVYPPLAGRLACRPFRQRRTSFSFLQDMGHRHSNPARRLPLPKVSRNLPTVLSAEQVQQLLAAAQTPDRRLPDGDYQMGTTTRWGQSPISRSTSYQMGTVTYFPVPDGDSHLFPGTRWGQSPISRWLWYTAGMPRLARMVVPGVPYHVTQRGNNRQQVFWSDDDRRLYLALLKERAQEYGLVVLGWCLMPNHVHLVVTPRAADSLAKAIGRTHFTYTQHVNRVHGRSGHLWQGRFWSCALDEAHCWAALCYLERNPVRAGLTGCAWRYRWSSAAAHCGRRDVTRMLDLRQWGQVWDARRWQRWLRREQDEEALRRLRAHTRSGRPLGSERFLSRLERALARRLRPLPVGRPRKTTQD